MHMIAKYTAAQTNNTAALEVQVWEEEAQKHDEHPEGTVFELYIYEDGAMIDHHVAYTCANALEVAADLIKERLTT